MTITKITKLNILEPFENDTITLNSKLLDFRVTTLYKSFHHRIGGSGKTFKKWIVFSNWIIRKWYTGYTYANTCC